MTFQIKHLSMCEKGLVNEIIPHMRRRLIKCQMSPHFGALFTSETRCKRTKIQLLDVFFPVSALLFSRQGEKALQTFSS